MSTVYIQTKDVPLVSRAFKPMITFTVVTVLLAIIFQVWSYNNESRSKAVQFWTGGLGVLGVIAVGCAAFVLVWSARVFDDSLRAIQRDVGHVKNAAAKMSDQIGRSVSILGVVEGLLSNFRPQ
jgi:prolipoprotein diacylglyceryltransferase